MSGDRIEIKTLTLSKQVPSDLDPTQGVKFLKVYFAQTHPDTSCRLLGYQEKPISRKTKVISAFVEFCEPIPVPMETK